MSPTAAAAKQRRPGEWVDPLRGVYEIDPSLTFGREKKSISIHNNPFFFSEAHCVFFLGFGHNSKTVASCDVPLLGFEYVRKRRLAVITDPSIKILKKNPVTAVAFAIFVKKKSFISLKVI